MLHPQARALLDLMESSGLPPTHTLTPEEARRLYRERRGSTQPAAPDVASVQDLQAQGPHGAIPLRLYLPLTGAEATGLGGVARTAETRAVKASGWPVLVYFHGGGWVIGDLDTHDTLCRQLANGAGCAVVAVDYRMGPEHRFPAAVDDCLAATRWVRREAARLGLDASRMAVGGDSAGGNLAAVVAIAERDARHADGDAIAGSSVDPQNPALKFQLLIYPATDMRRTAASHTTNGEGYLLTRDTITYFHDHYITDPAHDLDWRASPLLHPDLAGLPPALVLTAGYDPLRDEGLQYAQRLSESGNRATLVQFEREIHGFVPMGKVLEEANTAVLLCAAVLRQEFQLKVPMAPVQ